MAQEQGLDIKVENTSANEMATALFATINAFTSTFSTIKFLARILLLVKCSYKLSEKQNINGKCSTNSASSKPSYMEILHPLQVHKDIKKLQIYPSCNKIQ